MSQEQIRFSILIPVYNSERYLDDCVQSVLAQTYPHFELILVDDGSTDTSGEICDRYAAQYAGVSAYHKPNVGQLHTRVYALERATGSYCVFLDSDDYLEPQMLERMAQTIDDTSCDCVIFGFQYVRNGKVVQVMTDKQDRVIQDKRELYRACFLSYDYNSVCRKVVKTDLLKGIDYEAYYHIKHGEDLLQSLDVFRRCHCVAFIKDVLYNYRYNPSSVTNTLKFESFTVDNTVRETVLRFLQEEQVFNERDFEEYRGYCIYLLTQKLCIISRYDIPFEKKRELFNNMQASSYYKEFLQKGRYDRKRVGKVHGLYRLFAAGHYRLLITAVRLLDLIKRCLSKR